MSIGLTKMSTEEMRTMTKGIGVDNLHFLNDGLWKLEKVDHQQDSMGQSSLPLHAQSRAVSCSLQMGISQSQVDVAFLWGRGQSKQQFQVVPSIKGMRITPVYIFAFTTGIIGQMVKGIEFIKQRGHSFLSLGLQHVPIPCASTTVVQLWWKPILWWKFGSGYFCLCALRQSLNCVIFLVCSSVLSVPLNCFKMLPIMMIHKNWL